MGALFCPPHSSLALTSIINPWLSVMWWWAAGPLGRTAGQQTMQEVSWATDKTRGQCVFMCAVCGRVCAEEGRSSVNTDGGRSWNVFPALSVQKQTHACMHACTHMHTHLLTSLWTPVCMSKHCYIFTHTPHPHDIWIPLKVFVSDQ